MSLFAAFDHVKRNKSEHQIVGRKVVVLV